MPGLDPESLARSLLVYGVVRAVAALPQLFIGLFGGGRLWDGDAVWVGLFMVLNAAVAAVAVFTSRRLLQRPRSGLQPASLMFLLALFDGLLFAGLWVTASPAALRLVSVFLIFTVIDLFAGWTTRTIQGATA